MEGVYVKLLACNFSSLSIRPSNPPSFFRDGRPVSRAETLGLVVARDRRRESLAFLIDDGTGCVPCILWLKPLNHRRTDDPSAAEIAAAHADAVRFGSLVRVRGQISAHRGELQITVADIVTERAPTLRSSTGSLASGSLEDVTMRPLPDLILGWILDEFVKLSDRCSQSDATPQEEMSIEVLGSRPGYLRGYGVGPKPSSSRTIAQFRAHEEARSLREVVESQNRQIETQNKKIEEFEIFKAFMMNALQHAGFVQREDRSLSSNNKKTSS